MIKVAIVGCGKIADAHAAAIAMIPEARIVGVYDREELMAKQLWERFEVQQYYADLGQMLELAKPDVVHITTPPQSHFDIATACLNSGCHVYIEKPFTLNTTEAKRLIQLADERSLKLTVGTDEQYSHAAVRMRQLVRAGYLGGPVIHMEECYGYDLGEEHYARAILGDRSHWTRALPGQLLHNNVSHGIAKIAEFLTGENMRVIAHGFTSRFMRNIGENDIIDELRVIINDDDRTTAYFTFSSQMRPLLREFRIFGPKNGLVVNESHQSVIRLSGRKYVSYLEKAVPLNDYARQYRQNIIFNAKQFIKRNFHMKAGLRTLIESFYDSITAGTPLPISYKEIILTSEIMDSIFSQVYPGWHARPSAPPRG
jgi:predicted dehydrogenase